MVDSATLHDLVLTRLQNVGAAADVDVYDVEVPATPPLDPDGRVHAYAVLHAGPGALFASAIDGIQDSIASSIQVTCVGGDPSRALGCVDAIRTGLAGAVTVDGVARLIRVRPDDIGPLRVDPVARPPRHYAPVEFELLAP